MDVPHFMHPKLLEWAFDDAVLDLVEPITGPDIVLYSSHFISKPKGNGKRVPLARRFRLLEGEDHADGDLYCLAGDRSVDARERLYEGDSAHPCRGTEGGTPNTKR
jgi:hypothetical protein